jgi:putative peptidoglycan lipid II flippase
MSAHKTILQKTIEVGGLTLLSKVFGILREGLMVRYLGASGLSDAFIIAYRIPNSLRKIFAEGALSAAFTPTAKLLIKHNGKSFVAGLTTLSFIIFEGMIIALCALVMIYAHPILSFLVPGFSQQQITQAVPMLHILMPYIFFISSSALFGGSLHAVNHFFIPAFAPFVMNIIYITGICICLLFHLPITVLCWFILLSGAVQCALHFYMYLQLQFSLGSITREHFTIFLRVMMKFLLCLPSISLMEIALYVDTQLGSYLKPGSISLFFYANRFVGIPLGVFAVAFSTILLPHFSHIYSYSPKRLHFYLLESTKLVMWVTLPIALLMAFFSEQIFSTLFLSEKFSMAQAQEAGHILLAFLCGLFFFSLNKILLNIFYAMHTTWIPALVTLTTTIINVLLNWLFIGSLQSTGLALATSIASMLQTIIFLFILRYHYHFRLYLAPLTHFLLRYLLQLTLFSTLFFMCYCTIAMIITSYMTTALALFFTVKIGLWLWVGPLALLFLLLIYFCQTIFGIKLHFLK